ncbi:hypothetical protein J6590_064509 [Homalodisca vitripennis]|nr:hypothetical protein J6590_064509 [Homalodisca vitripennis]
MYGYRTCWINQTKEQKGGNLVESSLLGGEGVKNQIECGITGLIFPGRSLPNAAPMDEVVMFQALLVERHALELVNIEEERKVRVSQGRKRAGAVFDLGEHLALQPGSGFIVLRMKGAAVRHGDRHHDRRLGAPVNYKKAPNQECLPLLSRH